MMEAIQEVNQGSLLYRPERHLSHLSADHYSRTLQGQKISHAESFALENRLIFESAQCAAGLRLVFLQNIFCKCVKNICFYDLNAEFNLLTNWLIVIRLPRFSLLRMSQLIWSRRMRAAPIPQARPG